MAFKYIALFAFVAMASAIELQHAYQPVVYAKQPTYVKHVEHEAPAEYAFEYSVHDEHTGDVKSQKEVRHGDNVEGHYTLIDADGHRRVVHYTADEHNGFQAKVDREYVGAKYAAPAVQKVIQYEAAPVYKYEAAPQVVKYEAPQVKYVQAAPQVKYVSAPASYASHGTSQVSVSSHGADYHY